METPKERQARIAREREELFRQMDAQKKAKAEAAEAEAMRRQETQAPKGGIPDYIDPAGVSPELRASMGRNYVQMLIFSILLFLFCNPLFGIAAIVLSIIAIYADRTNDIAWAAKSCKYAGYSIIAGIIMWPAIIVIGYAVKIAQNLFA